MYNNLIDSYYRAFNNEEINQQTMEKSSKEKPQARCFHMAVLKQGAGLHKGKVKRGGIAYLAKDREGKEVFKGCNSITESQKLRGCRQHCWQ